MLLFIYLFCNLSPIEGKSAVNQGGLAGASSGRLKNRYGEQGGYRASSQSGIHPMSSQFQFYSKDFISDQLIIS
jgi:hypothetical protein